jgi:hypothetical protein
VGLVWNKLRVPVRFMVYGMGCVDVKDWMGLRERDVVINELMPIESMAAMMVANWLNTDMMLWIDMVHVLNMMDRLVMRADTV